MNEFMKKEPVRETLVRNHRVHERDCGHEREVRQRGWVEAHPHKFGVERRNGDPLAGKNCKTSRIERRLREEGTHSVLLAYAKGRCAGSVGIELMRNERHNLLSNPFDLSGAQ